MPHHGSDGAEGNHDRIADEEGEYGRGNSYLRGLCIAGEVRGAGSAADEGSDGHGNSGHHRDAFAGGRGVNLEVCPPVGEVGDGFGMVEEKGLDGRIEAEYGNCRDGDGAHEVKGLDAEIGRRRHQESRKDDGNPEEVAALCQPAVGGKQGSDCGSRGQGEHGDTYSEPSYLGNCED